MRRTTTRDFGQRMARTQPGAMRNRLGPGGNRGARGARRGQRFGSALRQRLDHRSGIERLAESFGGLRGRCRSRGRIDRSILRKVCGRRIGCGQFACCRNHRGIGLGRAAFGSELFLIAAGIERERSGLAAIGNHRHAQQGCDAQFGIFRPRLHYPAADPAIELFGGHVLRGHQPGIAPASVERVGIGEVLAHLGRIVAAAQCIRQDRDPAAAFAGQRIGQA